MKLSMKTVISFCLVIASFISLGLVLLKTNKYACAASVIADSPCDPLYYESLAARAWLEAQREITQNQNLILKPDSVFQYTCFDRLVWELADHADEMFSETSRYGGPLGSNSMDGALQRLVGQSLISYLDGSFNASSNLLAGHAAATGIWHTARPITTYGPYSCDIMGRVWQAAKCINFISNSDEDGFFTFQEYATTSNDKRYLPTRCSSIMTNWNSNLLRALTSGPWTNDPVQTYFDLTDAPNCSGANCQCRDGAGNPSTPIPTGIRVVRTGYNNNEYDEHICIQPGCHYHPGGDDLASGLGDPGPGCYGR